MVTRLQICPKAVSMYLVVHRILSDTISVCAVPHHVIDTNVNFISKTLVSKLSNDEHHSSIMHNDGHYWVTCITKLPCIQKTENCIMLFHLFNFLYECVPTAIHSSRDFSLSSWLISSVSSATFDWHNSKACSDFRCMLCSLHKIQQQCSTE